MHTYKEDSPINTINKIRQILYTIGMLPIEHSWYNPIDGLHSVRIENTKNKGGFGTNGKGRDPMFALASAYAEFIERIQNGFIVGAEGLNRLFLNKLYKENGFYYYPDEKFLSKEDFLSLPSDYLKDIFGDSSDEEIERIINLYFKRARDLDQKGIVSVPFYDCKRRSIIYLPYNLTFILSGSNGMAAGNTPEECIFQALCELIERYSARTIFFDKLTPPTVPENILTKYPKEYDIIQKIRNNGYEIQVKDFSCGIGLPAVGVIIIDHKTNKYRLNIGAETSFQYALSRSLTEIYQGIGNDSIMKQFMLSIPVQFPDYFLDDSATSRKRKELEIREYIINGLGVFPPSLFAKEASYPFSENTFVVHESYQQEVKYLIELFNSLGHSVYIRDVSFLNFPSCYVYIPSVSVWGRKTTQDAPTLQAIEKALEHDQIEDIFFPSSSLLNDSERIKKLLDYLAPQREIRYSGISLSRVLKIDLSSSEWSNIPTNFFITLLCIANKEFESAQKFLKEFMHEVHAEENDYYNKVLNLLTDLGGGLSNKELKNKYGLEFLSDFSSLERLFTYVQFPTCPDCRNCPFDSYCLTKANFNNAKLIAQCMKENGSINQNKIENIIYDSHDSALEY